MSGGGFSNWPTPPETQYGEATPALRPLPPLYIFRRTAQKAVYFARIIFTGTGNIGAAYYQVRIMSTSFITMLDTFRTTHDLLYAIICSSDGHIVAVSGDLSTLPSTGLSTSLFGDSDAIVACYNSLTGQHLPQQFSQGDMYCVVHKPRESYLVGLFGQGRAAPVEQHYRGEQLAAALETAWIAVE